MPVFYLDASAIAKQYLPNEHGVEFVIELLHSPHSSDTFVTSTLSLVEVKAAISRRIERPDARSVLLSAYEIDVHETFEILPVDDNIIVEAGRVVESHRLRAGDAIHLASALSVAAVSDDSKLFMVSSDVELLEASEAAGIGALDPQSENATASLRQIRE